MEDMLETHALCKRYRNFTALNGLDMHIPKGSIYGFVGRNGAGKTTLIRLICGLQLPTSGRYTLYGVRNTDAAIGRCRRRMGAVVESPAIYPDMTAEENLRQQALVLGLPSDGGAELSRLATHYGSIDGGRMVKEMSAGELEARCRKCMRLDVSDTRALARVLDRQKAEYRIVDDTHADLYTELPVTELVLALDKERCAVRSIKERDESLESFYMDLIGGVRHA